jgi:hypothetical protein
VRWKPITALQHFVSGYRLTMPKVLKHIAPQELCPESRFLAESLISGHGFSAVPIRAEKNGGFSPCKEMFRP